MMRESLLMLQLMSVPSIFVYVYVCSYAHVSGSLCLFESNHTAASLMNAIVRVHCAEYFGQVFGPSLQVVMEVSD